MAASVFPLAAAESERAGPARGRSGRGRLRVVPANVGDYPGVQILLTSVFQGPRQSEFRASLDDPFYKPHHRLLVKSGPQIVAHVYTAPRLMQFGPLSLPVAWLDWLAALPEYRGRGLGRRLLIAAEEEMLLDGALVGLMWTKIPHFFRRNGWALCGCQSYRRASAREVISGLLARGLLRRRRRRLNIRPFRRVELGALVRIHDQNLDGAFGPVRRTEAYWNWLVQRGAYDQIAIALDGPDLLELEEIHAPVVGYAVTRGERIVELHTAPGHASATPELLARACHDAMEHGRHSLRLDAPADSRIDKLFRTAGGSTCREVVNPRYALMAKLLDPARLLQTMGGRLRERAEAAGLSEPVELGFAVDGRKSRLGITRDGVQLTSRAFAADSLCLNVADFTRLVLGHLDWSRAFSDGRVIASSGRAAQVAPLLFPKLPLWCPPFDHLQAIE